MSAGMPPSERARARRGTSTAVTVLALVAVILIAMLATHQPGGAFVILLVAAIALTGVSAGVFARDRAMAASAPPGAVTVFARSGLRDLQLFPLTSAMARQAQGRLSGMAQGWVEGRLTVLPDGLRFTPGRYASKAGFIPFEIARGDLQAAAVTKMRLTLVGAMTLTARDGASVPFQVRRSAEVKAALDRLMRASPPT